VSRSRLGFLLFVLLFLAACHLIASLNHLPLRKKGTFWLTQEKFYQYIEGETIALPDGAGISSQERKSLTLHREQIESLKIEPAGEGPESEGAQVTFIVRTDQGRYMAQGFMSLHKVEGIYCPIVNLGLGWNVTKKK
jgi:hypothetical protein